MSLRRDLVSYAGKALAVAAVTVGVCFSLLWMGMRSTGIGVAEDVSAADLVSTSTAFATLVATIVLAVFVARFGAQQSRDEATHRLEKDLAITAAQQIVSRLGDLYALLRQPSEQATYRRALDLSDEVGVALRQLGKLLDLLGYSPLGEKARALYAPGDSDVRQLRLLIEKKQDDLDKPLTEAVRQTVSPFVEELTAKVLGILVQINRSPDPVRK